MVKRFLQVVMAWVIAAAAHASPIVLAEDFNDPILEGWDALNVGTPGGTTSWFLGNSGIFPAQAGDPESYVAANFEAAPFGGNIDLWLFTPVFDLSQRGGLNLSFFTRSAGTLPDRLEIYASGSDTSTDIANFHLLLSINPLLGLAYPTDWTHFDAAFISAGTGRFAFRYYVNDTSINGDYIGIDTVRISYVPEPSALALFALGLSALALLRRRPIRVR